MGSTKTDVEQASKAAAALTKGRVVVMPAERNAHPIDVPPSVAAILAEVLDYIQRGEGVRVIADDEEITTQEAADLLRVSRPYLVGLTDRGVIPCRKVGSRRRLKLADVLRYRAIDQAKRLKAADELAAQAQELGVY